MKLKVLFYKTYWIKSFDTDSNSKFKNLKCDSQAIK